MGKLWDRVREQSRGYRTAERGQGGPEAGGRSGMVTDVLFLLVSC